MLRMADRVFSQGLHNISQRDSSKQLALLRSRVVATPNLIIDNCAASLFDSELECDRAIDAAELPSIKPPFSSMFVEYEIPNSYRVSASREVGVSQVAVDALSRVSHVGVWVQEIPEAAMYASRMLHESENSGKKFNRLMQWMSDSNAVTMIMMRIAFSRMGRVLLCPHVVYAGVDARGGLSGGNQFIDCLDEQANDSVLGTVNFVAPVYFALSLCHCKNVEIIDATDRYKQSDKWKRRQGCPDIKYHVLEIETAKKTLRSIGNSDTVGFAKALHVVRGHFATYTEDKPLFGKIVGTVWKPSHARGDVKVGTVVKDYSIGPRCESE